jgi:subtilisin family serine protease
VADFTNRSATLDMLAPGVAIDAPIPGNKVGTKQGTSMAAPHVAGALALLRQAVPWAGQDALEIVMKENGQRPTLRVGDNEVSTIKVDKALSVLRLFTPTATEPRPPTATATATRATQGPPTATPTEQPLPSASHTPTETVATATRTPSATTRPSSPTAPITTVPLSGKVYLPVLRRGE